ncbi:MAG: serine hydrolase [Solirubrobacterales bacterium]
MGFGFILQPGSLPIQEAAIEQQVAPGPPNPSNPHEPDEWLRRFAALPMMHQPGETWMYDTAFSVLGVLLARAASQPLDVPGRTHPRAAGHDRHRLQRPDREARPSGQLLRRRSPHRNARTLRRRRRQRLVPAARLPRRRGGLVSTIDDYLAFAQMLLSHGQHGNERLLSRASVETMTTDHLTGDQKAAAGPFLGHNRGLGIRPVHHHDARRHRRDPGTVRVGRRPRHLVILRPGRGHGRHPHDPTHGLLPPVPTLARTSGPPPTSAIDD